MLIVMTIMYLCNYTYRMCNLLVLHVTHMFPFKEFAKRIWQSKRVVAMQIHHGDWG